MTAVHPKSNAKATKLIISKSELFVLWLSYVAIFQFQLISV